MKCQFCKSEATYTCTYKQPDERIVLPEQIKETDVILDTVSLQFMPVKKIRMNGEDYAEIKLASEKRKIITRSLNVRLPCKRIEQIPCGHQVCENHIREFDEDELQCAEHWPGFFEKVYGVD